MTPPPDDPPSRRPPSRRPPSRRPPSRRSPSRRIAAVALVLAVLGFALVAALVTAGMTAGVDRWLVAALRTPGAPDDPLGPEWIGEFLFDVTHAGGRSVLVLVGLLLAGLLAVLRQWWALVFLVAALGGGIELSGVFKALFERARPDMVPHLAMESSPSFPSGHATYSAIAYLTFALLLSRVVPSRPARAWIAGAAGLVVLLVGFSRVYLGVHYPSDVLAGWCLGTAWALACWLAVGRLMRRGQSGGTRPG